jgi:hypothetical protein
LANQYIPTLQRVIEAVHFARHQYTVAMIAGAHFLLFCKEPEADRAFFKTVLEFPLVDLDDGWLLFALPPAELAVHPDDGEFVYSAAKRRRDRPLPTDSSHNG